jgi:type IV secretion system protein VirB2
MKARDSGYRLDAAGIGAVTTTRQEGIGNEISGSSTSAELGVLSSDSGGHGLTGATSLQSNILAWATPIAVILVMALGIMAMANRISWGWPMAAMVGIAVVFGAPQMVTWIRGMFGV